MRRESEWKSERVESGGRNRKRNGNIKNERHFVKEIDKAAAYMFSFMSSFAATCEPIYYVSFPLLNVKL